MPNYRRVPAARRPVFITVVTAERCPMLIDHIESLRQALRTARAHRPFYVAAAVILPDHCHFLIDLPADDPDFSIRVAAFKAHFSHRVGDATAPTESRVRHRERGVWQRRFWDHVIRDEADYQRHVDYIHYNPVKHGLADAPMAWPYSSFRRWVAQGVYPEDWGHNAAPAGLDFDAGESP